MVDQLIGVSDIRQAKPEEDPLLVGEAAVAVLEVPGGGGRSFSARPVLISPGSLTEDLLPTRRPAGTCGLLPAAKSLEVVCFHREADKAQRSGVACQSHSGGEHEDTPCSLHTALAVQPGKRFCSPLGAHRAE